MSSESNPLTDRPDLSFAAAGVDALLMQFGQTMDPCLPGFLAQLRQRILSELGDVVHEVVPAYSSLLVYYEPRAVRTFDLEQALEQLSNDVPWLCSPWSTDDNAPGQLVEVPVCYDPRCAPDLDAVMALTKLSAENIIALHKGRDYQVYALGFAPGFAYLGALDEQLQLPRMKNPRTHVPAGAVGIAGQQTAVYPLESPGGWHLIGASPFVWFRADKDPMTPVQVGDRIRFYSIDFDTYESLRAEHDGKQAGIKK
ncbi:5-oxoprolinase subunit PxpB [Aliidiomarina halalkaliphila]|uniref:5-oxoprolinase subunit PxpB n=1 Tax=Aliidiomarina halalkaliphila TaxID=2593535 RepID=A0A552X3S1_9GAMM|nr:5-oxoprolinase subunit PxpB [Aliidiomarina halalkaliphila]TRW49539.1 5-oxoprolinase subunit PxpB [Aliidiomarina halalkaliphila]